MSELCKYSGKPLTKCKNKCGGCESHIVRDENWIQPVRKDYKMECCDCGLVHSLDFRVFRGRAQFRARRDNRRTAIRRKQQGKGATKRIHQDTIVGVAFTVSASPLKKSKAKK